MGMTYANVGRSGLKVSRIGLGSWLTYASSVDASTAVRCLRAAQEAGIVFIDTADIYALGEAESMLGEILADVRRQDLVLATKAFWPMSENVNDRGLSRKHLFESVENSLRRLRTEYIDLYQCHRYDPETPVEETVRAMDDLIRQGKVLYWGVSCWSAAQIVDAVHVARQTHAPAPISNQPPYNMFEREIEREVIGTSEREGLSQLVFSPLAQGLLTGKYQDGQIPVGSRATHEHFGRFLRPTLTEENFQRVSELRELASDIGVSLSQLALAWCLRVPNVASVIMGASRAQQVTENVVAADIKLVPEIVTRIDSILDNAPQEPASV